MPGYKINICYWYVEDSLVEEITSRLIEGNYQPVNFSLKSLKQLQENLDRGDIDLIFADFDLPEALRKSVQDSHTKYAFHIPLIYLVGERNERKAAETLKRGAWDYLIKNQFVKLVPTVYSSQKYGKVVRYSQKVKNELEESELKYQEIFNSVKNGIIIIDPETLKVVDFNKSIRSLFGIDENLSKEKVIEFLSSEGRNYCREELNHLVSSVKEDSPVNYLCYNSHAEGDTFWSENTVSVSRIGNRTQYILVVRNIQEQKNMEDSLKETREHFRNLAENSPDVIMRFDRNFRHLYVNKTAESQTSIPVDEFLHKTHEEMGVWPEHLIEFWEEAIKKVFETEEENVVEFNLDAPQGRITLEWRLFPEFDDSGMVITVLAIARDITESRKAGLALKESEERLKLAIGATNLGLWDYDVSLGEIYYSDSYFTMLGYDPGELPQLTETWEKLLHPEDKEHAIALIDEIIQGKRTSFETEFRLRCKDGNYKWIRGNASRVEHDSSSSRNERMIGTHEDISRRKRNMEIQETLFNISNAVNSTKNLDELYERIREFLGKIVDTTNCFLALYNEESGMFSLPFHRDEVDSFNEFPAGKTLTGYVVSTGKVQLIDAEREKQLEQEGHIELVGSPCVSWLGVPLRAAGKIIGVFVVQSYKNDIVYTPGDVSIMEFVSDQIALAIERKRDQDNIRENQERQRRIFESSPDPIIIFDSRGKVIDYNTSLLSVLHITNEPIIGEEVYNLIPRREWRKAIESFKRTWEEGYLKNIEFTILRADGTKFESEVSTGAMYTNQGEPDSMVVIFKDITERKSYERNLKEAKEKAEESDHLKTAFLSNMSHEIRTPMNAIVGFSDLLNDPTISREERSEFIAQINLGADNLMHLIDDIIDIAKIEAGQLKINLQDCSLRRIVDEQIIMFTQNLERMDKKKVELRLNWECKDEVMPVKTDPFRVKQILTNLLNNAIKFTDEGFVELGVQGCEGASIRIYVKDSGIGIDEAKQGIIFDRFMQGHNTKAKLYGGTGLGLAISKNLTELLGGEIGVISDQQSGSEFWFTLPLEKVAEKPGMQKGKEVSKNVDWSKHQILIAEDDDSNFLLLTEILRHTRIVIVRAKNGLETVDLFERYHSNLDLILMDMQMPEKDGFETTKLIKDRNPGIPIIAQTAYAMAGEAETCKAAGCDDYISKPIQVNDLFEKLTHFLKS